MTSTFDKAAELQDTLMIAAQTFAVYIKRYISDDDYEDVANEIIKNVANTDDEDLIEQLRSDFDCYIEQLT
jgi:hypothetical protein